MEEQLFNPGDVVVLKSGGEPMTVELVRKTSDMETFVVHCTWFDGKKAQSKDFRQSSLIIFEPPSNGGFYFA